MSILTINEVPKEELGVLRLVDEIIGSSMEGYNIPYVNSCIELGICSTLIASLEGKPVGVGVYYIVGTSPKKIGVVYYVAVKKGYRGLGIGKALIASIEEVLTLNNVNIYLATTKQGNSVIRKILTSFGYVEISLDELNTNLGIIEKITCGYDDDLLLIKISPNTAKDINHITTNLKFLEHQHNVEVVNKLWRKICYEVWLRFRKL